MTMARRTGMNLWALLTSCALRSWIASADPAAALKLFLLHPQSLRLTLKLDALVVTYFFQQPCYPL